VINHILLSIRTDSGSRSYVRRTLHP